MMKNSEYSIFTPFDSQVLYLSSQEEYWKELLLVVQATYHIIINYSFFVTISTVFFHHLMFLMDAKTKFHIYVINQRINRVNVVLVICLYVRRKMAIL